MLHTTLSIYHYVAERATVAAAADLLHWLEQGVELVKLGLCLIFC